jgi:monomeric isocitrate dehydrogenase
VQNIGLMAQKAEEYGSHPTTFEIPESGTVKMVLDDGTVLHEHKWRQGDIWRSASARKAPDRGLGEPRHRAAEGDGLSRDLLARMKTAPMMRS